MKNYYYFDADEDGYGTADALCLCEATAPYTAAANTNGAAAATVREAARCVLSMQQVGGHLPGPPLLAHAASARLWLCRELGCARPCLETCRIG